jgi:probable HAF family extracellular repeat protein
LSAIAGNQNYHAFLYKDGVMTDLGFLGNTDRDYYSNSQANGINNSGQVVGWSADDIGHQHAPKGWSTSLSGNKARNCSQIGSKMYGEMAVMSILLRIGKLRDLPG